MTGHTDEIDPKTPRILAMTYQMVLISHFSFLNLGFHTASARSGLKRNYKCAGF